MTLSNKPELPIKAMKIKGAIKEIPVSEIKSGKKPTISINNAIVAYVDILGFSKKNKVEDIESTLLDFSGSLTLAARRFPKIRFNVFSDNAFLATSQNDANDLISAMRFAFASWCSNGILVRGGLAIGEYQEFSSVAIKSAPPNFTGNHFAGSAVIKAVKLENNPLGAFIFTDKECANFLSKKFHEPIFTLESSRFIGWSDEDHHLFQFTALSLFRLIRILQKNEKNDSLKIKFINNIRYAKKQATEYFILVVILSILSMRSIDKKSKRTACKILKIKDPQYFQGWNFYIKKFIKNNSSELKILKFLAYSDSSIE